jgi:hypothetical protein
VLRVGKGQRAHLRTTTILPIVSIAK